MTSENPVYRFREEKDATPQDRSYQEELERYFATSVGSNVEKLRNFTKYSPRQSLTQFLSRYEIYKRQRRRRCERPAPRGTPKSIQL